MPIFADDYVTEKFFSRMSNTVTVVMGGADYEKLASPHSYVNVLDYPPPRALASYLLELDQDKEKYRSYFWW
jgi:alpha-1,3-fucosyltransferase